MSGIVLRRLKELKRTWDIKRISISTKNTYTIDDITISIPGANWIQDYGLVCDHGIFNIKLPSVFINLWAGNPNDCIKLMNEVINYQQKMAKDTSFTENELKYSAWIINVISWVLKYKYGLSRPIIRKITTGDHKPKTHFTV